MIEPAVKIQESWVVPFRSFGARLPLFCPCAGGGNAFEYQYLFEALPEDQPMYAFGAPDAGHASQFPTVESLAAIYVRKVRELQPSGPYRLCGHSFGGLVVFEMARLLTKMGQDVALVAMLDTIHPQHFKNMSLLDRVKFQSHYFLNRTSRYSTNLSQLRINQMFFDAHLFLLTKFRRLIRNFSRTMRTITAISSARIEISEVILVDAWHNYIPSTYEGNITLFVAGERPPEFRRDLTLGWRACTTGNISVYSVPGDHKTLLRPPHVHGLAEQLVPHLGAPQCHGSQLER